jgi:hypothetical protein
MLFGKRGAKNIAGLLQFVMERENGPECAAKLFSLRLLNIARELLLFHFYS